MIIGMSVPVYWLPSIPIMRCCSSRCFAARFRASSFAVAPSFGPAVSAIAMSPW